VPGYAVTAVDTTGAGDAFSAAVITAALRDAATWDTERHTVAALRRACAYAALSTTRPGAMPSYGDEHELNAFMSAARVQHGR
jgi:sugar/nucleoside kinase (ribokinase family)